MTRAPHSVCPSRAAGAFTLVELLVVISIIAVLMALLFPAMNGVRDQAKKTQAKNDITQIVTAVTAYYTEYGKYPVATPPASGDFTYDGLNSNTTDKLFNALRAIDLTLNPRGIVFVSPPAVKDDNNPRSGISGKDGQWYDPWGKPYIVRLDTDYDNLITPNPYSKNAGFKNNVNSGAISWSFGKDGKSDSVPGPASDKTTGTNSDDVISWQ